MGGFRESRSALVSVPLWLALACGSSTPRPPTTAAVPEKPTTPTPGERLGTVPDGVGLTIGDPAPDVTVTDADGKPVRLLELAKRGPILLVFYRGGWCPTCNFQIHELAKRFPELRQRGLTPVAISVDPPDDSARTRAAYAVPFPVLSDPELAAHRAFKVVDPVTDDDVLDLKQAGVDRERHKMVAVPSIFVIGTDGKIYWSHADRDPRTRPTTDQILGAIDAQGPRPRWR